MSPSLALVLEWAAVVLNIGFTILIGREQRLGWLFGFVAAICCVALYLAQDAWLMAVLNGFYAAMGLYGWWTWGRAVKEQGIIMLPWRRHALLITICIAGTLGLVWLMDTTGIHSRYRWMEAFVAASAAVATWLMSRKALENWWYWIVGDSVAVVYNHWIDLRWIALLNVVYIVLAVVGSVRWWRQLRAHRG